MIYFTRGLGIAPGVGDIISETHIDYSAGTTQSFFYIQNHRGDTVALVNENGEVVGTYEYNAWGEVVAHSGQDAYFTFSSKHFDEDAELYYYGFRWYDPITKRWTQPDPSGLDEGLDLYRFCDNDPINLVDVYGLWSAKAIADSVRDYRDIVKDYIWINTGSDWADTAINGFSGTIVDMSTGGLAMNFALNSVDRYHQNVCELNNNKFWAATDALNLALGDIVGYTMLLEGCFGADRASLSDLSTRERWFRGVAGGLQTAFFVVGAAEGLHGLRLAPKSVKTPYGTAIQENSSIAHKVRAQVKQGGTVYKGGVLGKSETGASQFLATESPLNPSFAGRYGIPSKNANFDFILTGKIKPSTSVITRSAPGIPPNPGGAIEAVINAGDFVPSSFYMP